MIVEAFVGTGVILMFAVVAGLGFGGLRLLTKYFLPGRVFDRGERVEIIQLGISASQLRPKTSTEYPYLRIISTGTENRKVKRLKGSKSVTLEPRSGIEPLT